jgi:CRP-like cAMP-binding protein
MNASTFSAEVIQTEIFDLLSGLCWQQSGAEPDTEALTALRAEALKVQRLLEAHESARVTLPGGHQTVLQRSTVDAWLQFNHPELPTDRPPLRCPVCKTLMQEKWNCLTCGLELDSPEQRQQRKGFSLDSRGPLPPGYFFLADPRRRRVIGVYAPRNHEVIWQINFSPEVCLEPVSVQYLGQNRFLVCDRKGQRVLLCDRSGRLLWSLDHSAPQELHLDQPCGASLCLSEDEPSYLIVDQGNHRVLRVSASHELLWSYGIPGLSGRDGGCLNRPSDLQRTGQGTYLIADTGNHRVIEVQPATQKIIWQAEPAGGLQEPTAARRLLNGRTRILDSGHHRVLEIDRSSLLLEECIYFRPEMDPRFRLDAPLALIQRENQNLLIQNEERVFEVMLLHKQLQWFSLLTDLRLKQLLPPAEAKAAPLTPAPAKTSSFLRPPASTFNLPAVLRQISIFEGAPSEFYDKIKLCMRFEEHPAGKILLREGQKGDALYLIRRGQVEVLKDFQVIATLGEGEIFGEMALILSEPRSATVRAQSACQLYKLNKLAFETVVRAFPEVYERIRTMAEARQSVSQLKNSTEASGTARLEQLMQAHKSRLQELRDTRLNRPSRMSVPTAQPRMIYSPIEQHILEEARAQNYAAFEIAIHLNPRCRMKSVRVSLLVMVLEKHGTLLKIMPIADDILLEKLDLDVSLTLLTRSPRAEVLEDVSAIAEIDTVSVTALEL